MPQNSQTDRPLKPQEGLIKVTRTQGLSLEHGLLRVSDATWAKKEGVYRSPAGWTPADPESLLILEEYLKSEPQNSTPAPERGEKILMEELDSEEEKDWSDWEAPKTQEDIEKEARSALQKKVMLFTGCALLFSALILGLWLLLNIAPNPPAEGIEDPTPQPYSIEPSQEPVKKIDYLTENNQWSYSIIYPDSWQIYQPTGPTENGDYVGLSIFKEMPETGASVYVTLLTKRENTYGNSPESLVATWTDAGMRPRDALIIAGKKLDTYELRKGDFTSIVCLEKLGDDILVVSIKITGAGLGNFPEITEFLSQAGIYKDGISWLKIKDKPQSEN